MGPCGLGGALLVGYCPPIASCKAGDLYTFTRLEGPDKGLFFPHAINARGMIVGEHTPAQTPLQGIPARAVLRDTEGRFTTIEPPGGRFTGLNGINARGQIVGSAVDAKWTYGFVREPDGRFIRFSLDSPDATNPVPVAINDAGAILGNYTSRGGRTRTFLRRPDGGFRTLPGGGATTYVGLNSRGQVVGHLLDLTWSRRSVLLDDKDKPTLFDWPGTTLTQATAINDQGVIVGVYLNVDDPKFGLHRSFVRDTKGKLSPFDFPGARQTQVSGINNAGQIIGRYEDHDGDHGFLAVPKGQP